MQRRGLPAWEGLRPARVCGKYNLTHFARFEMKDHVPCYLWVQLKGQFSELIPRITIIQFQFQLYNPTISLCLSTHFSPEITSQSEELTRTNEILII